MSYDNYEHPGRPPSRDEYERLDGTALRARVQNPSMGLGLRGYFVVWWDSRPHRAEFETRAKAEAFAAEVRANMPTPTTA